MTLSFGKLRVVLFLSVLMLATSAHATWSILAVDEETGQVGSAGASCTWCVYGITALEPGVGGIVVQAASNSDARETGIQMLREGATPGEVLAAVRDAKYDPENQQYAVIALKHEPAVYSGTQISDWAGAKIGPDVTVQGNILVSEEVLTQAMAAYEASRHQPLAERLMAALEAGAAAGGDARCGDQHARSAFVTVFDADNARGEPYVNIAWYGVDEGADPAVVRLAEEFARWKEHGAHLRSTRRFIVQGKGR